MHRAEVRSVEADHAAVLVPLDGQRPGTATHAAVMHRDGVGHEQDAPAGGAEPQAEIEVFAVEEEAIVPGPRVVEGLAGDQRQGARDGLDLHGSLRQRFAMEAEVGQQPRRQPGEPAEAEAADEGPPGRGHAPSGTPLFPAADIGEQTADHADAGGGEPVLQADERTGSQDAVGVEEQHGGLRGERRPPIAAGREAGVGPRAHDPQPVVGGEPGGDHLERADRGGVVDEDHLGGLGERRLEAVGQEPAGVVVDDHHADRRGRGGGAPRG